ncbi:Flp pilus assembly protein CpaB [Neobacillus notoginsengisoli]|uniref:Flp pilus assembly protein CpaB n=1 Tax=Neobacillus notoginsengisoli TaxID=1578198 RepID=A0A417YZ29_9BACI|nr:Flp pilus assembly protein CpaB [Neobacillus notoginsengisoli]RHW43173.1 Flp pilus assembly protein CpaB [Neobacillus notoginsengisoli]
MKSKTVLLLSLVMGIITTALFFQYMSKVDQSESASGAAVPMAEILVAKDVINKNEKITAEKLEVIKVPEESISWKAMKTVSEAEGKLAGSKIEKGEPILAHRLLSQKDETIYVSRKVREGYRAVTVSVNLPQSVSNLIEAEDWVDVIFSKEDKEAKVDKPKVNTKVLLEKARVLAVGRKISLPEEEKKEGEQPEEYTTVTLELTPQDAFKLIHSSQEGNIHFMLHTRPAMNDDGSPLENENEG